MRRFQDILDELEVTRLRQKDVDSYSSRNITHMMYADRVGTPIAPEITTDDHFKFREYVHITGVKSFGELSDD